MSKADGAGALLGVKGLPEFDLGVNLTVFEVCDGFVMLWLRG